MKTNKKRIIRFVFASVIVVSFLIGVFINRYQNAQPQSKYANSDQWVYCEADIPDKHADVFFIAPSAVSGDADHLSLETIDNNARKRFLGAINMQKGIYDDDARFFSPFYRQATLSAYKVDEEVRSPILETAYADVKEAFDYYMLHYNNGRPLVIAGFSQGAEIGIRLLKEYAESQQLKSVLVACYAIGWRFTEEEKKSYPYIRLATGEKDTGVLISFNSEAVSVTGSMIIPEGTKTYAINPLNWSTGNEVVDKSYNLGACFIEYSGDIKKEIPNFTGAYIDKERGALKVIDVQPEEYTSKHFETGVYHLFDYQFFYRNLEKNVHDRINAFIEANS